MDEKVDKKKWPQYLSALITVVATFSAGIHYSWPTPSLPKLLAHNITSEEGSYIVAVASIGDIVGNVVFTLLADAVGRKLTILLIGLPQVCSLVFIHFSGPCVVLLYLGRFLGGVAEGGCLCVIPLFLGEISEARIRGFVISFFSISWCSGCLFINIVGSYYTIETASLITLIFPVVFLVTFLFVPESPYYLLIKNQIEESRTALRTLRWSGNVEEELGEIHKDVRRQMSEKGRYEDLLLIPSNRSALLIMLTVISISEFSGISSLTFYAQLFFAKTTTLIPGHYASSLLIFLQLVFSIVSSLSIDYVGRRPLLLSSICGCGSSLLILSIYFFIHDYSSWEFIHLGWVPLAGMIVFMMFFNLGVANVVNCLNGELFSASIKTKAACVSAVFYSVCVVIVTKVYQILSDGCSLGVPFLVFALAQLLGWSFCWGFVPETKEKTLEEIQQEIKKGRKGLEPCEEPLLGNRNVTIIY